MTEAPDADVLDDPFGGDGAADEGDGDGVVEFGGDDDIFGNAEQTQDNEGSQQDQDFFAEPQQETPLSYV